MEIQEHRGRVSNTDTDRNSKHRDPIKQVLPPERKGSQTSPFTTQLSKCPSSLSSPRIKEQHTYNNKRKEKLLGLKMPGLFFSPPPPQISI